MFNIMKKINTYLRKQAELRKQYECASKTQYNITQFGVIGNIDDIISEDTVISDEFIDNYITENLSTSLFGTNTNGYWTNIFETLVKSHDYKSLITRLEKYFGAHWKNSYDIDSTSKSTTKSFTFYLDNCELAKQIQTYVTNKKYDNVENDELPEDLLQLMNFFNYYFSKVKQNYYDGEISSYEILCEPKYSDKVTDLVYKKYNGILYHVTTKENVQRIMKRGLQMKGDKNMYRYIEPRINFILANTEEELINRIRTIVQQKGYKRGEFTILKIDLNTGYKNQYNQSSYQLDFYHDAIYHDEWSVYTYGLIHPRFISVVE